MNPVDILVITALQLEYDAAMAAVSGGASGRIGVVEWAKKPDETSNAPHLRGSWLTPMGDTLTVALARPTRMGITSTLPITSALIERLKPRALAMCGACAGNPGDVVLGDVIIAETTYTWDEGKRRLGPDGTSVFEGDHRQVPILNSWLRAAQDFRPAGLTSHGAASVDEARIWLLERLAAGEETKNHRAFTRYFPGKTWPERVKAFTMEGVVAVEGAHLRLTESGRDMLDKFRLDESGSPDTLPFEVRVGPMASGNVVVKDGLTWEMLRRYGVRSVVGLEMEASAMGRAAFDAGLDQWVVAKGVMDYADPNKADRIKPFAARASAEVLFAFLAERMSASRTRGRALSGARRIFVLGGLTRSQAEGSPASRALEADLLAAHCFKLGGSLARANCELVVCSPFPGAADVSTVIGYIDAGVGGAIDFHSPNHPDVHDRRKELLAALGQHQVKVRTYEHPAPVFVDDTRDADKRAAWGEAWRTSQLEALRHIDAIVAIGGQSHGSAITTLREAESRSLPILPLALLGGAAKHIYDSPHWKHNHPRLDHPLLATKEGVSEVISLLGQLVTGHALATARQGEPPKTFFISRAGGDANFAMPLVNLLDERGLEPVLGDQQTSPDRGVASAIHDAIRRSDVFIALWSQRFAISQFCIGELDLAMELNKSGKLHVWILALDRTDVTHAPARKLTALYVPSPSAARSTLAAMLDQCVADASTPVIRGADTVGPA